MNPNLTETAKRILQHIEAFKEAGKPVSEKLDRQIEDHLLECKMEVECLNSFIHLLESLVRKQNQALDETLVHLKFFKEYR